MCILAQEITHSVGTFLTVEVDMDLTPENKAYIDSLGLEDLLREWRNAPVGNTWFQGETGDYWGKVMGEKRDADPGGWVGASKRIGWDG